MGRRRLGGARGAGSGNIRDLIESTYGHLLDVRHRSSAVEYRETEVVQLPTAEPDGERAQGYAAAFFG